MVATAIAKCDLPNHMVLPGCHRYDRSQWHLYALMCNRLLCHTLPQCMTTDTHKESLIQSQSQSYQATRSFRHLAKYGLLVLTEGNKLDLDEQVYRSIHTHCSQFITLVSQAILAASYVSKATFPYGVRLGGGG